MKSPIHVLLSLTLLLMFAVSALAQNVAGPHGSSGNAVANANSGGVVTLYALDPLANSLCFRDAGPGKVFQEQEVRNRCSDLNFHSYAAEQFSVGIEGGREGVIVDLGSHDDLRKAYGYEETVGGGQGFASLRFQDGKVLVLKDRRARTVQDLKETGLLLAQPRKSANAPIKLGHIYLVRITDRHDRNYQSMVKLMVIAYRPEESVTLRWEML